ncbi:NAD(P)-binding protein [Atractiella rhizophila]|nr:NAD(P)-binding protein [Atractiella rhizophila]
MSTEPFTLRWGILATGWISQKFALDLLVPASTRASTSPPDNNVVHKIVAVSSSSSLNKAEEFVKNYLPNESGVKSYGNYDDMFKDGNVEVVYVGTPHSRHYEDCLGALKAGKHVLCEKALTVNGKQAEILFKLAKEKNLFFMEAVWTRFQPVTKAVLKALNSGVIGPIHYVQSHLHSNIKMDLLPKTHRLLDPMLCGGALTDLGPYSWTWMSLLAPSLPTTANYKGSSIIFTDQKVDGSTTAVFQTEGVQGVLSCGFYAAYPTDRAALVVGEKGRIWVEGPLYRPQSFTVQVWDKREDINIADSKNFKPAREETFDFRERPGGIWGFAWEADEVARCIRDGKIESETMSWALTAEMMNVFDKIREANNFTYPEQIERV